LATPFEQLDIAADGALSLFFEYACKFGDLGLNARLVGVQPR
jgi:hypothetical protein